MEKEEKQRVDEDYKAQVEKEKLSAEFSNEFVPPEATFSFFIATIAMQITIALGEAPNPQDNKTEKNLPQAKFLIDTLSMLQEKTKNNLSSEEASLLDGMLYELRMRYVQKSS